MDNGLNQLLESDVLGQEIKTALQEAFQAKLDEIRKEVEETTTAKLRDEFESDKAEIVEAMDRMLTEAVNKQATKNAEEVKKLREEREKLNSTVKSLREDYQRKTAEHNKVMEQFVLKHLEKELAPMRRDHVGIQNDRIALNTKMQEAKAAYDAKLAEELKMFDTVAFEKLKEEQQKLIDERKSLSEQKVEMLKALRETRIQLAEETQNNIKSCEEFFLRRMNKEVAELNEDKRYLKEQRIIMETEARNELNRLKAEFISRSSKLVENNIEKKMAHFLTEMKDEIIAAKEIGFGRKLFDSFVAEFMVSHLSEGTVLKSFKRQLDEAKNEVDTLKIKLNENISIVNESKKKVQISEARLARATKMNELMRRIREEHRPIMENLLAKTPTDKLEESFKTLQPMLADKLRQQNKTLPNKNSAILQEDNTKTTHISGSKVNNPTMRSVTGNRETKLMEAAQVEPTNEHAQILELRQLAGLNKI